MNSSPLSLAALIVGILALTSGVAAWWNLRSFNKLRRTFFAANSGGSLEDIINALTENHRRLQQQESVLENEITLLKTNFKQAVQKVGVVRFNPFADGGGNFSFSLALLDGRDNGLVLTSMHGREQNRIYTKKIQKGKSETALTGEEQQALAQAIDHHHKQII